MVKPLQKLVGAIFGWWNRRSDPKARPAPVLEDYEDEAAVEDELEEYSDAPPTIEDFTEGETELEDSPPPPMEIGESEPEQQALEDQPPAAQDVDELGEPEERGLEDFVQDISLELPELKSRVDALLDDDAEEEGDSELQDEVERLKVQLREVRTLAMMEKEQEPQILTQADPGDTRTALGQTQGTEDTDTWVVNATNNGVEVEVVTDVKYDTTTFKITYRTRTLKFDANGLLVSVTAESAVVDVTTAAACP